MLSDPSSVPDSGAASSIERHGFPIETQPEVQVSPEGLSNIRLAVPSDGLWFRQNPNSAFDASTLERDYDFLDDCPETLIQEVITFPVGTLSERVTGIRRWRDALLSGQLPPLDTWPTPSISGAARSGLEEMNLPRFCKDQPDLVDELLRGILGSFLREAAALREEVARHLKELERLERIRMEDLERKLAKVQKRAVRQPEIDEEFLENLCQEAKRLASSRPTSTDQQFVSTWGERARVWAEIADVFGDLGEMMGRGWDMTQGVLRHTGWGDLLRLRELLKQLPQIQEIVRSLGRLQVSEDNISVAETIMAPVRRLEEERLEVRTPHIPAETRGVERRDRPNAPSRGSDAGACKAEAALACPSCRASADDLPGGGCRSSESGPNARNLWSVRRSVPDPNAGQSSRSSTPPARCMDSQSRSPRPSSSKPFAPHMQRSGAASCTPTAAPARSKSMSCHSQGGDRQPAPVLVAVLRRRKR